MIGPTPANPWSDLKISVSPEDEPPRDRQPHRLTREEYAIVLRTMRLWGRVLAGPRRKPETRAWGEES